MLKKHKIDNLKERERMENLILKLENSVMNKETRETIKELKLGIDKLLDRVPNDDHKLFLSEIVNKENPKFTSNNLILAPIGSGKSTLIELLVKDQIGSILLLVSNRFLKDDVCPDDNEVKQARAYRGESRRMFTSKNKTIFGNEKYSIHVMTYAEFGSRIQKNNKFLEEEDFIQIHCDEIHSLPEYKKINKSEPLIHAIKYLFSKHEQHQIFYYTATRANLDDLEREIPGTFKDVMVFDYLNHPDIKQYMALSEYKINHIEQVRPHLSSRLKSFKYFGHKGLAFSRTISGLKRIEEILIEEGYKPLVLWSDANDKYPLSELQKEARTSLINTNHIPDPYNFLVINSAMREGWDLKDPKLKLAIMNTTNETDLIQARGRIRKDIDILIYRTNEEADEDSVEVPQEYLGIPLISSVKKDLCQELNIVNKEGSIRQWVSIKPRLIMNGYQIKETRVTIEGKRLKASIINKKED